MAYNMIVWWLSCLGSVLGLFNLVSVCLSVCLSPPPPPPPLSVFVCLSACLSLSIFVSVCLSVLSICLSVCLSVCLFVCQCLCLCLSVCLSLFLSLPLSLSLHESLPSRQQGGPCRGAGLQGVRLVQHQPSLGQPGQGRGGHLRVVDLVVAPAHVVRHHEQDVGLLLSRRRAHRQARQGHHGPRDVTRHGLPLLVVCSCCTWGP